MSQGTDAGRQGGSLPLEGLRVVEFVHMIMGPSAGLILADLGAEVIKVEPIKGDNTRRLTGSGAGFFVSFNRNKKSICVDVKSPEGLKAVRDLVKTADVVTENFKPGGMDSLGLGYGHLSADNPGLIYVSLKGFLKGPYEHRKALDEVVQMMAGLAYMTGPPGRPLRAGASINDMMGGMFAVIGVLAALRERDSSGKGQHIQSALFENNAWVCAQHMTQYAITGQAPAPMPNRLNSWGIYDIFDTSDDDQIFIGVVTDTQWKIFCDTFDLPGLYADERLDTNPKRCAERPWLVPEVGKVFKQYTKADLMRICDEKELPFAPITQPPELLEDPHLLESGGLLDITVPGGIKTKVPTLPIEMDGRRFGVRLDVPHQGEHTRAVLRELGYPEAEIDRLIQAGILAAPPEAQAAE